MVVGGMGVGWMERLTQCRNYFDWNSNHYAVYPEQRVNIHLQK